MKATLRISLHPGAGVTVLGVAGEVDLATADEFAAHLRNAVRPDRALIVDLRELTYIDMRGVKALEDAGARATAAGQRCVVVSSSALIKKIFSILQIDGRVDLAGTLDDALKLLGRPHAT